MMSIMFKMGEEFNTVDDGEPHRIVKGPGLAVGILKGPSALRCNVVQLGSIVF
jgi:hypothetical protein